MEIPKKHKAIIYSNPGTLTTEIVEVDTPEPQAGEILIRLTHSGVCHTDLAWVMNNYKFLPTKTEAGQIGGHEGVGTVVKLGEGVGEVQLGDTVGVKWVSSTCLACVSCQAGFDSRCKKAKVSGLKSPGTFQQYIIGDPKYVTPIPKEIPREEAAPLLCGGVTVWSALQLADAKMGDWVGISGAAGGLGHLAVQYAKALGLRVIGIDHGSKGDFCKQLGVDHFLDFTKFDPDGLAALVKELTDGGCHAVLVCNASSLAYDQALGFLRYAGTLVCVGIPEDNPHPMPNAVPWKIIQNLWKIKGTVTGNRKLAAECLKPAALGLVRPVLRVEPMNKLTEIFTDMKNAKLTGRVVLDLSRTS